MIVEAGRPPFPFFTTGPLTLFMWALLVSLVPCGRFESLSPPPPIRHAVENGEFAGEPCWHRAIASLRTSCRVMDHEARGRLAVHFTNCHLRRSNLTRYPCRSNMTLAECTLPMVSSPSAIAFKAYTTFTAHADSLCFYHESEAFQRNAEAAVEALHASTRTATVHIGALGEQTGSMLAAAASIAQGQREASASVQRLLSEQEQAAEALQSLRRSQASAFASAERELAALDGVWRSAIDGLQRGAAEVGAAVQQRSMPCLAGPMPHNLNLGSETPRVPPIRHNRCDLSSKACWSCSSVWLDSSASFSVRSAAHGRRSPMLSYCPWFSSSPAQCRAAPPADLLSSLWWPSVASSTCSRALQHTAG